MRRALEYANAVLRHWVSLLTGSIVIAFLFWWQGTGHTTPSWWYWSISILSFFPASFRAWDEVHKELHEEKARSEGPQLMLKWDQPIEGRTLDIAPRQLQVENRSDDDAYNVQVERITLNGITADFPCVPIVRRGSIEGVEPALLGNLFGDRENRLELLLYGWGKPPSRARSDEYYEDDKNLTHLKILIAVTFNDYGGRRFRAEFEFDFELMFQTTVIHFKKRERLG